MRRFDDEIAAYIAQIAYMKIKNPGPHVSPIKVPANRPLTHFQVSVLDVIDRDKVTEAAGLGASISEYDVFDLSWRLHAVARYAKIAVDSEDLAAGNIPIKGNGMRQLKMALWAGSRARMN